MSYKIISIKCDQSKNDWVSAVCAEATLSIDGENNPIYIEVSADAESDWTFQCEQNKRSIHSVMIFETEEDIEKLRKGGKIFKSYEGACRSKYGDVYPILAEMIKAVLKIEGIEMSEDDE